MASISITAPPVPRRSRISVPDLLWVVWRRHRAAIVALSALALLETVALLITNHVLAGIDTCQRDFQVCYAHRTYFRRADYLLSGLVAFPVLVTVFLGVPALTQEYESGAYRLAWTQDVSPRKWLLARVVILGGIVSVLSLAMGLAAMPLTHTALRLRNNGSIDQPFAWIPFESGTPLLVLYSLFALVIGLAAAAVIRTTMVAIACSVVAGAAIRAVIALAARLHYLPVQERTVALASTWSPPDGSWVFKQAALVDAAGNTLEYPAACPDVPGRSVAHCLSRAGATGKFWSYQPAGRLGIFQGIEAGIFLGLSALFLVVVFMTFSRQQPVLPLRRQESRSRM